MAEFAKIFEQSVASHWPESIRGVAPVTVAVSGGADSMALLRSLAGLVSDTGQTIVAAHVNHGIRGEAADEDERWLRQTCQSLNIPFVSRPGQQVSDEEVGGQGLEAALRNIRYPLLMEMARETGSRYLATAHTLDDNVETILFRMIRGTGLAGLMGIPRTRRLSEDLTLVRPLLHCTRDSVEAYLQAIEQDYRTDATNRDLAITRNRIRHRLLPLIKEELNPNILTVVSKLAKQAAECNEVVAGLAREIASDVIDIADGSIRVHCEHARQHADYLLAAMFIEAWKSLSWPLQDMSYEKWRELTGFVKSVDDQEGVINLPGDLVARKVNDRVDIAPVYG